MGGDGSSKVSVGGLGADCTLCKVNVLVVFAGAVLLRFLINNAPALTLALVLMGSYPVAFPNP